MHSRKDEFLITHYHRVKSACIPVLNIKAELSSSFTVYYAVGTIVAGQLHGQAPMPLDNYHGIYSS